MRYTSVTRPWSLVIGVLLLPLWASAATYYLDVTSGVDSAGRSGSSAQPWKTVTYALGRVGGGQTLMLADGTYPVIDLASVAHSSTTLKAVNKWQAIILGSTGAHAIATETGVTNITIDGLQVSYSWLDGIKFNAGGNTVRNCWIHHSGRGNPAAVENDDGSYSGQGIYTGNWANDVIEYNLIENNGMWRGHDHAIYCSGTNYVIRGNVLRNNLAFGLQMYTGYAGEGVKGFQVSHNLIYGNKSGITCWSGPPGSGYAATNYFTHNTVQSTADGYCFSHAGGVLACTNNIFIDANPSYGIFVQYIGEPATTIREDYNLVNEAVGGAHDVVTSSYGFVNSANGLYWLTSGSAARNAAASSVFPSLNFFGQTQTSAPDIGAFTYSAAYAADTRTLDPSGTDPDYWETITIDPNGFMPADRIPTGGWSRSKVGVQGGIPTYTVHSQPNNASGDDTAAIQAALNACPAGYAVLLTNGTWTLSSSLSIPGQVVLRGIDSTNTVLNFTGSSGSAIYISGGGFSASQTITAGKTVGSTVVTVASTAGFVPGRWLMIYVENAVATEIENIPSYMTRTVAQWAKLSSTNATQLTLDRGLKWVYSGTMTVTQQGSPKYRSGVENLRVVRVYDAGDHNIELYNCQECWVKGVESRNPRKWHIRCQFSAGCEFRENFVRGYSASAGGGDSVYGIGLMGRSGECLIEDNMALNCRHAYITEWGGQGNVIAYNYSKDPINESQLNTDFLMIDGCHHGGDPRFNLWEGNVIAKWGPDDVLGGSRWNTFFRGWIQLEGLSTVDEDSAFVSIQRNNVSNSVIASVIGMPDRTFSGYDQSATVFNSVRELGMKGNGWDGSVDSRVLPTVDGGSTFWHGVYTYQYGATNTSGYDTTFPASLYLSSKPSFFGGLAWPAIGPDVSTKTNLIPAMARYYGYGTGTNPPPPVYDPPVAGFYIVPGARYVGQAIYFEDGSSGEITSRSWTFGDGGTSTTASPTHSYAAAATYTVIQTVTGPGGSSSATNTVEIGPLVTASFTGTPTNGPSPMRVTFTSTTTGAEYWFWTDQFATLLSTNENPEIRFFGPTAYTVTLTASNHYGATATQTRTNYITFSTLASAFTLSATNGCVPLAVVLTNQTTGSPTGFDVTWGDGTTDSLTNHTYTTPGTHGLYLTSWNADSTNSTPVTNITARSSVLANFVGSPLTVYTGSIVQFSDQSGVTNAPVTGWGWDINNDGTVDYFTQNAQHVYAVAGSYSVHFYATNACGTDDELKAGYVTVVDMPTPPTPGTAVSATLSGEVIIRGRVHIGP